MAECKETVATMLDVQVQTAGGFAAAAKRGGAARPARQAVTGNVRVPERAAEAAPSPAEAELMRAPVLPRQDGEGGGRRRGGGGGGGWRGGGGGGGEFS